MQKSLQKQYSIIPTLVWQATREKQIDNLTMLKIVWVVRRVFSLFIKETISKDYFVHM